ncbi:type III secretion system chaperone [Halodesulfovibrio marinisediminis]|nr:type III secretion system chaperone [Halodesulfovibrio marinisediminis]
MNNRQKVQHILTEFSKHVELESIKLNKDGSCRLFFDKHIEVNLELDDTTESLFIISPVIEAHEDLYADALELNLFWGQLKGSRFVLLRNINVLALMRRLSIETLEIETFEETLEQFLETITVWRKAFEENPKEEQAAACGWNAHTIIGRA